MKKIVMLGVGILLITLMLGCASTKQHVPFPDQTKRIEDPNKARVYVVRPTSFGGAIPMKVSDGNKLIGNTGAKGYLCWEREPGKTEIIGKAENTSKLPLTLEMGMVYYIQQNVRMGILFARNKLSLLTEEDGKKKLKICKPPEVQLR